MLQEIKITVSFSFNMIPKGVRRRKDNDALFQSYHKLVTTLTFQRNNNQG